MFLCVLIIHNSVYLRVYIQWYMETQRNVNFYVQYYTLGARRQLVTCVYDPGSYSGKVSQ